MPFLMFKHIFKSSGKIELYTSKIGLAILAMIDVILLVDTEVAIKENTDRFQLETETQWTFGQTLALLLLLVAFRDLVESILEKRGKQLGDKLIDASKRGELDVVTYLLARGVKNDAL
ncbi:hypothetical protein C0995_006352, partial [Termitomyces sp. Mi166